STVDKSKGSPTAMKSGMTAAEAVAEALAQSEPPAEPAAYRAKLEQSWLWDELKSVRNIRPGFHWGLLGGLINAALDTYIFRGKAPWTLPHRPDHTQLKRARGSKPIAYPKPDGTLTF